MSVIESRSHSLDFFHYWNILTVAAHRGQLFRSNHLMQQGDKWATLSTGFRETTLIPIEH